MLKIENILRAIREDQFRISNHAVEEMDGRFQNKEIHMKEKIHKCLNCGIGTTKIKDVQKILSMNTDTVLINVKAEVCDHCGERYYDPETVRYFEKLKLELKNGNSSQLIPVGTSYKVAS